MTNKNSKTLELTFRNQAGTEVIINVLAPSDDVTSADAKTVADDIILKNLFSSKGGDLVAYVGATIRDLSVTSLA